MAPNICIARICTRVPGDGAGGGKYYIKDIPKCQNSNLLPCTWKTWEWVVKFNNFPAFKCTQANISIVYGRRKWVTIIAFKVDFFYFFTVKFHSLPQTNIQPFKRTILVALPPAIQNSRKFSCPFNELLLLRQRNSTKRSSAITKRGGFGVELWIVLKLCHCWVSKWNIYELL